MGKSLTYPERGYQMFLGPNIPKREKYTKLPQTIPKLYQMTVYVIFKMVTEYANNFHSMALQNLPKLGFLV
jgi:hypothetical protein